MTVSIQLAIQGGGAKITHLIAALEAVQSLQRHGILRVTRIAGTSAGAIAGALFASGVDMQRARDAFESHRDELLRAFPPTTARLRAAWCLLTRRPFWDAAPLRRLLVKLIPRCEQLGDLEIPLTIVAADLTNMQARIYDDPREPLISSLMDSAGIPFFLRIPPGRDGYRVIVDGGVCENLPSDHLTYDRDRGEVVGITFSASRAGAPLRGYLDFTGALVETAMNASVLRAKLDLGPNNFVIHTTAGSFDFEHAFDAGLGAEYRETRLLAREFFEDYAERAAARERDAKLVGVRCGTELPAARLQNMVAALRSMYRLQQERMRFAFQLVRMIVTGASQRAAPSRQPDQVFHEIVFRATEHPVSCYRIRLSRAAVGPSLKTQCEVFDCDYNAIPFDLVPIVEEDSEDRDYLVFFREPILPGDARAPVTLRVRDTIPEALRLLKEGRDELLTRASRADGPIDRVEIVVHLPEELGDTVMGAANGSGGSLMTPAELLRYAAPAGFVSLGWKGNQVPPNTLFGCNLVKR